MEAGREVSAYQQTYVMALLREFNCSHRQEIAADYKIDLPPIDETAFLKFAALGQKSKLHLSKFLHQHVLSALRERVAALREQYNSAEAEQQSEIAEEIVDLNRHDIEQLLEGYLRPEKTRPSQSEYALRRP